MVNSNTSAGATIIKEVPADRTTNSPNNSDMQEMDISDFIDEPGNRQGRNIYRIKNYGIVYVDSFNTRNFRKQNSDNNNYRYATFTDRASSNDELEVFSDIDSTPSAGPKPLLQTQMCPRPYILAPNQSYPSPNSSLVVPSIPDSHLSILVYCIVLLSLADLMLVSYLVFFMTTLPRMRE